MPQRQSAKHDPSVSPPPAAGDQLDLELDPEDDDAPASPRRRWAWLLAHVFQADLEHCPRCGGPMRWQDVATTEDAAARLMAKHGLAPQPPPAARPPPLGQLEGRECLDHVLILGELHLQKVLEEYCFRYFNTARPHEGLGHLVPAGSSDAAVDGGYVVSLPVLGGLHHEYRWAA